MGGKRCKVAKGRGSYLSYIWELSSPQLVAKVFKVKAPFEAPSSDGASFVVAKL